MYEKFSVVPEGEKFPYGEPVSGVPSRFQSTPTRTVFPSGSFPRTANVYGVFTEPEVGPVMVVVGGLFAGTAATALRLKEMVC